MQETAPSPFIRSSSRHPWPAAFRHATPALRVLLILLAGATVAADSTTQNAPPIINDSQIEQKLQQEAERLLANGRAVKADVLLKELPPRAENLHPMQPAQQTLSLSELYARARQSVLIVGALYKCGKCSHWHVSTASGFVISSSGAAVTNYHVIKMKNAETLVAMTAAGNAVPVTRVLAANEASDLAVVQIEATGQVPLPVLANAPVGARVAVVSHPDGRYYTLTEGILSRYAVHQQRGQEPVPMMMVTAEFARGSSGAPILDERGNAIGIVSSTYGIRYDASKHADDTQMVLKQCVPGVALLDLLAPAER